MGGNFATNIIIDKAGNIVVGGIFNYNVTLGPTIPDVHNRYLFVKYSPDGTQLWNTSYGINTSRETLYSLGSMVSDKAGNIYTAGTERFLYLPRTGILTPYFQFITTKINPDGSLAWFESENTVRAVGGYSTDLIVSDNENLYVTGVTTTNGIRTIKYVQCPSQANNARYGNFANNGSGTNEILNNEQQTVTLSGVEGSKEYVNMFPNPNDGNFYFNYSLPENEKCQFTVFDPTSKKVYSIEIRGGRNTVMINSNNFSNGVYYYQVTAGNRLIKTERLVITK